MLELKGISKHFPGVKALDNVSLKFEPGHIHGLVGENGAGKSTLIKIITGIYQPDAGQIYYEGNALSFKSYHDSLKMGIDIVNQELQMIPESSIAENIMLDKMISYGNSGIINWKRVNETAKKYMDVLMLEMSPKTKVRGLGAAQKQLIQIAKALSANAKVLLLDEPTSCLTHHEAANLFRVLRDLKAKGVTIIFISHKFEEVFELCDVVSVLRDGKYVGTAETAELTNQELIKMMLGRDCVQEHLGSLDVNDQCEVLRADRIKRADKANDISFSLYEGEILGFYGLVGAGRTELARIIIGEDKADSGRITVRGEKADIKNVSDSLYNYRIGYVSENRKEEGLLLDSSIRNNICITIWNKIINRFTRCINSKKEACVTGDMISGLDIKCTGQGQITGNLSGGNQQKVCLAKWLAADCDILIIDEPTIGVDVGAKHQIHQLIWNLAKEQKKSILLISSDLPEMVKLASRVLVFKDKAIVGEITEIAEKDYDQISGAIGNYLN
jgi:ribose transport system ATP-binding protein